MIHETQCLIKGKLSQVYLWDMMMIPNKIFVIQRQSLQLIENYDNNDAKSTKQRNKISTKQRNKPNIN